MVPGAVVRLVFPAAQGRFNDVRSPLHMRWQGRGTRELRPWSGGPLANLGRVQSPGLQEAPPRTQKRAQCG